MIGNDIILKYSVLADNTPEDLSNLKEIKVWLRHETIKALQIEPVFTIEGNVITMDVHAGLHKRTGAYRLFIQYKKNNPSRIPNYDSKSIAQLAFTLVETTEEAGGVSNCQELEPITIELSGDVGFGSSSSGSGNVVVDNDSVILVNGKLTVNVVDSDKYDSDEYKSSSRPVSAKQLRIIRELLESDYAKKTDLNNLIENLPLLQSQMRVSQTHIQWRNGLNEWQDLIMINDLIGKSAYQVAVDNGFSGTEQDWENIVTKMPDNTENAIKAVDDVNNLLSTISSILDSKVDKEELDNIVSTKDWTAKEYQAGSVVYYSGKEYRCNSQTTETDIPGASLKWDDVNSGKQNRLYAVTFNPITSKLEYWNGSQMIAISVVDGGTPVKQTQVITVNIPSGKTITSSDFNIGATVSSGLPLSYLSTNINVATVTSSGVISIVGVGSCEIVISQAGDNAYEPVSRSISFTVAYAVNQDIVDTELLVYGDSIANNVGASTSSKAWVQMVASSLGVSTTTKRTQAGCTVQEAYTTTARNSLEDRLLILGDYRFPAYTGSVRYCIVSLGMNDANNIDSVTNPPSVFKQLYKEQASRLINIGKYPKSKIVICNITPAKTSHGINARIESLNTVINEMCQELGVLCIDLYTTFVVAGGDILLSDNLHPNDSGHAAIAQTVATGLGSVVNQPPSVSAGSDLVVKLSTSEGAATASLSGSAVPNSGSSITSILWSKVSGETLSIANETSLNTTITFTQTGSYILRLTATDSNGLSSSDDLSIVVEKDVEHQTPLELYLSTASITDSAQITAVTNLYSTLVASGVYEKLWGLWLPVGNNSHAQKFNFVNPSNTITWVNDDESAHTSKGFSSSASLTRYGKTGLSITDDMLSSSNGLFILADNRVSDNSNATSVLFGSYRTTHTVTNISRNYQARVRAVLYGTNSANIEVSYPDYSKGIGPVAGNYRIGDSLLQLWNGASKLKEQSQSTTPVYTNELYVGATNYNNAPLNMATSTIGTIAVGKSLSDAQMVSLMGAVSEFNSTLGI